MLGINNQPFVSLDNYLTLTDDDWDDIYFEICLGMAKSDNIFPLSYYPKDQVYWPHHPEPIKLMQDVKYEKLSDRQKMIVKLLDWKHKFRFLKFYSGLYFSENQTLFLTKTDDPVSGYHEREQSTEFTDEAKENFPTTIKMLSDSGIFEKLGRVIIWGQDPFQPVLTHKDQVGVKTDYFLHINPFKNKKFFVFDESTGKKHYTDAHRVIMFNNADWHGCDPQTHFSVSLKVSGIINNDIVKDLDYKLPK
jgi:hypothetical protein